jgi:hypothetical protein
MKRLSLIVLCCVLLSGCIFDPVFDTSNWDAYQRSSAAVRAKLSNDDLRRLEIALRYIMAEGAPRLEVDGQQFVSNPAARANPYYILARLGPKIDGRSAAAVIKNLSIKLDSEISAADAGLQNLQDALGSIEVSSPRYYWKQSGYLAQPVVEFAVRNAGQSPISRIYFSSILTTPNRSIPWARQQFVQTFKGGLEPREKQQLTMQPWGDWRDPKLKDSYNAELKVTVTNFEDANGERVIAVDSDQLDLKRKVRAALQ